MQSFLNSYVKYHLSQADDASKNQLIIMPSKRSVAALKNEFASQNKSLWLPEIIDIVSFIERLSNLKIIDHQQSILEFYKVYIAVKKDKKPDAFENYYPWASVLLGDFNEIDRFLVDAHKFFEHHKALKTLNYFGVDKTKMIKSYIAFWEDLPVYYSAFKSHLLKSKMGYQGLAYRLASENIQNYLNSNEKSIVFLGFNALNKAEEHIFETCLENGIGKIAWDIDQSFLEDKHHPANVFIKKYQKKWSAYSDLIIDLKSSCFSDDKSIQILSSPKNVGQSKSVSNILNAMSEEDIKCTAIILNDENLLSPILNSIPKSIKDVNITMGMPLSQSPVSDFFDLLIKHQKEQKDSFSYEALKTLFRHSIIDHKVFSDKKDIINHLERQKILKISTQKLFEFKEYKPEMSSLLHCLQGFEKPESFLDSILTFINLLLQLNNLPYKQYLLAYQKLFTEFQTTLETYPDLSMMALSMLLKDKEQSEKLSFKGSKTEGLQIMGMLESRLLDFKNVILISVNEGILPAGKSDNSYITYNLKKQYNLPTHTEKDAIYAYHFFRLLQRAEQCFIHYDNDQTGFNKGEKSRFINYLEIFKSPKHVLTEKQFSLSTQLKPKHLIEIQKTPEIMSRLESLSKAGFSPTALTTYILNPILFYKRYVLGVKEPVEIEDVINHRDFGTLIHNTIEILYKSAKPDLNVENLKVFLKDYETILKNKFEEIYAKDSYHSGLNRIQFEIAKASVNRFLNIESDRLKASLKILEVEKTYKTTLNINNNPIELKGQIDRVDMYGDTLRIIDLKTGKVEQRELKFKDWESLISDYDYAKAFQILFYAYIYTRHHSVENLQAGIISFKNLNNWFMPLHFNGNKNIDKEMLSNFEIHLSQLIEEILNPDIPFREKEVNFES